MASFSEIYEELSKISMMAGESADKIQRLKEEENQITEQLDLLKQNRTSLCRSIKQLEQENEEFDCEFNNFQNETKNAENIENIYDQLKKCKPSSNDLKKLKEARKKVRMYQLLLGVKWDFVRMNEDPQLISGIVYNKSKVNLDIVSTCATDYSQCDIVEKMWSEIEKCTSL